MTGDWQIGDLALCIKVGAWVHAGTGELARRQDGKAMPQAGGVYVVRAVGIWQVHPTLWLEDFPGDRPEDGFGAVRFRKITPPPADEFDREVIELMREPVS